MMALRATVRDGSMAQLPQEEAAIRGGDSSAVVEAPLQKQSSETDLLSTA